MQQSSLFIIVLLFILPLIQSETIDEIKARYSYGSTVVDNTYTIPYRYFVPQNYLSNNKYAIITFLHGGGENGNDNQLQLLRAPIVLANDTTQSMYKFFIVAPQVRNENMIFLSDRTDTVKFSARLACHGKQATCGPLWCKHKVKSSQSIPE